MSQAKAELLHRRLATLRSCSSTHFATFSGEAASLCRFAAIGFIGALCGWSSAFTAASMPRSRPSTLRSSEKQSASGRANRQSESHTMSRHRLYPAGDIPRHLAALHSILRAPCIYSQPGCAPGHLVMYIGCSRRASSTGDLTATAKSIDFLRKRNITNGYDQRPQLNFTGGVFTPIMQRRQRITRGREI